MFDQKNIDSVEETDEVRRLLRALPRVNAPGDFEFGVRSRIARETAPTGVRWLIPTWVKAAVPAALLIAVGSYVGIQMTSAPQTPNSTVAVAAPSAEPVAPVAVPDPSTPQPEVVAATQVEEPAETPEVAASRNTPKPVRSPQPTVEKPGGGSYDTAAPQTKTIRSNTDVDDNEPESPARRVLISSREFLTNAGVSASYAGAGGKILSVGGAAAAAGVRAGDVIEAVNVQAGTLRVTRDGNTLTFSIK